jgi:hypothetical protein
MSTRTTLAILIIVATPLSSAHADDRQPGLLVRLHEIDRDVQYLPELAPNQLPNVVKIIPTLELRTDRNGFAPFKDHILTEVTGYLAVAQAGGYTFRLMSDDGAKLWIDDRLVVDHDGLHGPDPKDGEIALTAGEHPLRVWHFENTGGEHLELRWRPPGAEGDKFALIPPGALSHDTGVSRETSPGKKRIIPPLRRGRPGDGTPVEGMHPSFVIKSGRPTGFSHHELSAETMHVIGSTLRSADRRPYVWLPQTEGQTTPAQYWKFTDTRYDGDFLVGIGDSGHRVVLESLERVKQGCVLRFSTGKLDLFSHPAPTHEQTFEMLAVRAMTNGFEIEFTKPLDPRCGWDPESYYIEQWPFSLGATEPRSDESTKESEAEATKRRSDEGNVAADSRVGRSTEQDTAHRAVARGSAHPPQRDGIRYPVKSASVSPDRKKVFLEIDNLKESHVVYIRLLPPCISEDGELPWSTEAWYTLNKIPENRMGQVREPPEPEPQNFLTDEERAAGWRLLFDGRTTKGWRRYKKTRMPDGWVVKDGCLVRVGPGGDICTDDEFDNFELQLEWRIAPAGNSGIFFRVSEQYDWPFFTGPEFQVLDNAEHADGRSPLTSAGSNYGLHAPVRDVTEPVGFFNQVRIVANGPHVEHWLNGVKIVEYELWSDEWKQLVANSKFKQWPAYGMMRRGHFVLQDHGDMVWYRNIKVREIPEE